ncbi:MAG: ABC transporter substrate-binding protein [Actinomycetota bacterium]
MRRTFRIVVAVTLTAGLAVAGFAMGAGAQESASPADEKVTFTVGMVNDAITFNPMFMIETPEYSTADLVYDTFLTWGQEDMSTSPNLAESWEQSEDGLTWTFQIRDDITWHDGTPFTAGDIAFTFNFILEEGIGAYTDYLPFTDEIVATDDTTLVWRTTVPTSAPLYPPYIYIVPEHIFSQYEDRAAAREWKGFPDAIGTGPFELVEWRRGDFWRLEANPDYWGGAPVVDEFVFRVFQNEETMIQALQQGEIDFADDIPASLFQSMEGDPNITLNEGRATTFVQMSFNQCTDDVEYCSDVGWNHHPATTDPQFRLAVEHAIDRQTLVDRVRLGYATPGATVVLDPRWHHDPPNLVNHDPEEARRILDEAGYLDTDNDGIREMPGGGEPLELRFIVRTENPDTITAGEFISEWLMDVGIATVTEAVNDAKLTDTWYSNDWDMYIWGWGVEPDPNFQLGTYTTGQCGTWSDTCYSSDEYDDLYSESQTVPTVEERQQIIDELQQILYDDRPEIVLWYETYLQAYRSDQWTGFVPQPSEQGAILFQYGHYSDINIRPVSGEGGAQGGGSASEGGVPAGVWIGIVAAIVVIGAVVMVRRRREGEEEA